MHTHMENKVLNLFLLVDRTGSMTNIWRNTISTINEYVNGLSKSGAKINFNLAFFDKMDTFPNWNVNRHFSNGFYVETVTEPIVQHRYVNADKWVPLSDQDKSIAPRGMTPLYDAICEYTKAPKSQGLKKGDLVQFVIVTDGDENCSSNHDLNDAKKVLAKFEKKGWPVQYLGSNLESFRGGGKIMADPGKLGMYNAAKVSETAFALAGSSMRYMSTSSASAAAFTDEERKSIS